MSNGHEQTLRVTCKLKVLWISARLPLVSLLLWKLRRILLKYRGLWPRTIRRWSDVYDQSDSTCTVHECIFFSFCDFPFCFSTKTCWLDLSNITKVVFNRRKRIGFRSRDLFPSWMSPGYQSWSLAIAKWCTVNKYCALRIQYGKGKSLSMHVYTIVRSKFSFEPRIHCWLEKRRQRERITNGGTRREGENSRARNSTLSRAFCYLSVSAQLESQKTNASTQKQN